MLTHTLPPSLPPSLPPPAQAGMHAFFQQLGKLHLIGDEELEASLYSLQNGYRVPCHRIEGALKVSWADMGDRVSLQYAGVYAVCSM